MEWVRLAERNNRALRLPMRSRKKTRKGRHRPYEPIKTKLFKLADPFGEMPLEARRSLLQEAAKKARARFDAEYPKIAAWYETYDPLYLLSFCAFYFLTSPEGVDKEAIEGKLDFAPFHLELLQAFALKGQRVGSPKPLAERTEELRCYVRDLADALGLAQMDFPIDAPDSEVRKRIVISEIRGQTFAMRNWAYPEQALSHLRSMFGGALANIVASEYPGISIVRVIDVLVMITKQIEDRLNEHIQKLALVVAAKDFDSKYSSYLQAFPDIEPQREEMHDVFERLCQSNLKRFQSLLLMHADLRLDRIYTFSLDDAMAAYGDESCRAALMKLLLTWSHTFGELSSHNHLHFLYANPVLHRPLIYIGDNSFYWVLCGVYAHTLPTMLELLIPRAERDFYVATRSRFLEDQAEILCRKAFPNGKVYRGSRFRLASDAETVYENDILVVIDSTAIIIECKAHLVDPPARRGAELRLLDTLEDLVVSASRQAYRFTEFLRANPRRHAFETKSGNVNNVNASRLLRFIPISVTYESLGFVSANLQQLVAAGLIEPGQPLVPSICLTDLEVVLETLECQAERIHYLSRRAEIERTMEYRGDELDLFALYIDTGFNLGDWEETGHFLQLTLMSKKLDPYFVGRANGVTVSKPKLRLTDWWRQILARIEEVKSEFWTEVAYVFLSVAYEDQQKFERGFKDLRNQIMSGRTRHKHNWVTLLSGTRAQRQYGVIGYPYSGITRDQRNDMVSHIVAEFEQGAKVFGTVVLAIDAGKQRNRYESLPYDALMYVPGHAPGAINFGGLVLRNSANKRRGEDVDFHLKSPRPRR